MKSQHHGGRLALALALPASDDSSRLQGWQAGWLTGGLADKGGMGHQITQLQFIKIQFQLLQLKIGNGKCSITAGAFHRMVIQTAGELETDALTNALETAVRMVVSRSSHPTEGCLNG